jgi:hypothetical protein
VLRAPAITPRDEEMRPSGTLTSPTTGSIAILMQETEREEAEIAARSRSKDAPVQLVNNAQVTYAPATNTAVTDQSTANARQASDAATAQVLPVAQNNNVAPPQTQTAVLVAPTKKDGVATSTDAAMPQPKALALNAPAEAASPQKMDVASALKSIVSPTTGVSGTSASSKQDVSLTPAVEGLAPKSERTDISVTPTKPAGVVELSLSPDESEMRVGEKRQLALGVKTGAPLGLAVLTLRFDPRVMKINSVTPGALFANAKTAPVLSQSVDQNGMLLISLAPAAGSPISGEGVLLNIEFEAVAGGDSLLAFDLANVHLVASDGHSVLLQIDPVKLMVK